MFALGKRYRDGPGPGYRPTSARRLTYGSSRKHVSFVGRRRSRLVGRSRFGRRRFGRRFQGRRNIRFRRRFKKKLGRFRNRKGFRRRVMEAITQPLIMGAQYGQQHTVPDLQSNYFECVYFTAEDTVVTNPDRSATRTRALGGMQHFASFSDLVWPVASRNFTGGVPTAGVSTQDIRGRVYHSGKCVYTIRNQANETVNITAFYCRARRDWNFDQNSNYYNHYYPLTTGFSQLGEDPNQVHPDTNIAWNNDANTPFNSHDFTKIFHIYRVKRLKIDPSEESHSVIRYPTRVDQPENYFRNLGTTSTLFINRIKRMDYKRGEKFILFKLHSRPSGITGQVSVEKNIAHTTPTVIMHTRFRYKVRFMEQLARPMDLIHDLGGITSTGTKAITVDNTLVAGEEKDSS